MPPATTVAEFDPVTERPMLAPVPANVIVCGVDGVLSAMVTYPVAVPTSVGANLMVSVQVPPGAMLVTQFADVLKADWPPAPPAVVQVSIAVTTTGLVPVFFKTTVAELVLPSACTPKLTLLDDRLRVDSGGVVLRDTEIPWPDVHAISGRVS